MDQVKSIKNVAIVVAGGSGTRMGQDIPKQFINVFDKPVLIYTLESFQRHPDIDANAVHSHSSNTKNLQPEIHLFSLPIQSIG